MPELNLPVSNPPDTRHADAWRHNARVGLLLFVVYCALYGGFIGIAAISPTSMAAPALGGANLAVVYGMGLIVAAFVLALVYMVLCRQEPPEQIKGASESEIESALGSEGAP